WRVVPRIWSLLWSEISGRELPREIPAAWLKRWEGVAEQELPRFFVDNAADFEAIPRRAEIEEKNLLTVQRVLDGGTYHLNKFM
ncbi:MAG TPA: acetoin utilization protein AcuC, partial [Verrucomicrobiae bacterium]|nr:acetoin utilization protein AcuC [Verrucomicrobiae bacterium]